MYTIKKQFSFSASHKLKGLPETHPCSRPHGHNYTVEFTLESLFLNDVGFVKDYRELDEIKCWIDEQVDHRDLNEIFPAINPTAENLARLFYEVFYMSFPEIVAVTVKETDKTSATYEFKRN